MCACQVLKGLLIDIPRCTTTRVLDGKKQGFCYTQPGACSLEHTDSQGRSWSFQPCRDFSIEETADPKQFEEKPIVQRIQLVSECPRSRPCRTAKGTCCRHRLHHRPHPHPALT